MFEKPTVPARFFFTGQIAHLLLLIVLLAGVLLLVDFEHLRKRALFGVGAQVWFVLAIAVPIVHQVYVWLAWRGELCFAALTNRLGSHAFIVYQAVFLVLLTARPVSLTLLAVVDRDTLALPATVRVAVGMVLALPAVYTFYSVARYFGFARAAGLDHFDPECRTKPLVKEGAFRYSGNAMYLFGFLALWAIAVVAASWAALVAAGFSHTYIWVHYYCTERPDMQVIYG